MNVGELGVGQQRRESRVRVDMWAVEEGSGFTSYHRVMNMSASGLFFESTAPMAPGAECRLELELPTGRRVPVTAAVVHATATEREAGVGVRIVDLDPGDRMELEQYLARRGAAELRAEG